MIKVDKQKLLNTELGQNFAQAYSWSIDGNLEPCIKCAFIAASDLCATNDRVNIINIYNNTMKYRRNQLIDNTLVGILNKYEIMGMRRQLLLSDLDIPFEKSEYLSLTQKQELLQNLVAELEEHGLVEWVDIAVEVEEKELVTSGGENG